jgi:hypothetical protein
MKKKLDISLIEKNSGQIEGLPKNPRFIKDDKFNQLVQSIQNEPDLLEYRGLLVFPHNGKYVVIGGNQRLEACKSAGLTKIPCEILPDDTPVEKLKSFTIKDNSSYGEWDFALIESSDWLDFLRNNEELGFDLPADIESHASGEFSTPEKSISLDYTVFFDTKQECDMFYDFLTKLKNKFSHTTNVSKRILHWIAELYEENEELSESQLLLKLIKVDMEEDSEQQNTNIDYEQFKHTGI